MCLFVAKIYLKICRSIHSLNARRIILGKSDKYIEDTNTANWFMFMYIILGNGMYCT